MRASRTAIIHATLVLFTASLACNAPGMGAPTATETPAVGPASPIPPATTAPTPSGPLPDLVIEILGIDNATIHLAVEPWTWLHYRVTNIGQAATPIEPRAGSHINGADPSGYLQVEGILEPGASYESSFAVGHSIDSWSVGSYTVVLEADHYQEIAEADESNNFSGEITFEVVP